MVCLVQKICSECNKPYNGNAHNYNESMCHNCETTKAQIEKEAHFKFLNSLSVDARVRKIEEWIYDFEKNRVKDFAKKQRRYA